MSTARITVANSNNPTFANARAGDAVVVGAGGSSDQQLHIGVSNGSSALVIDSSNVQIPPSVQFATRKIRLVSS